MERIIVIMLIFKSIRLFFGFVDIKKRNLLDNIVQLKGNNS